MPVSYTHLDVYKRQIIGYAIAAIFIISSMESKKEEKIDSSLYRDKE